VVQNATVLFRIMIVNILTPSYVLTIACNTVVVVIIVYLLRYSRVG